MSDRRNDLPTGIAIGGALATAFYLVISSRWPDFQSSTDFLSALVALGTIATATAATVSIRQTRKIQEAQVKRVKDEEDRQSVALASVVVADLEQLALAARRSILRTSTAIDHDPLSWPLAFESIRNYFQKQTDISGIERIWRDAGILPQASIHALATFRFQMAMKHDHHMRWEHRTEMELQGVNEIDLAHAGIHDISGVFFAAVDALQVLCKQPGVTGAIPPKRLQFYRSSIENMLSAMDLYTHTPPP
jgi:hypothetical protein